MPIEVKYGSPGMVGIAGFAAGMGQGRQRLMQQYLPLVRQQMAERAVVEARERGYQFQADRDESNRLDQIDRDLWSADQSMLRDDRLFDRQQMAEDSRYQRMTDMQAIRGEYDIDQQYMEGIRRGQLELAPEAQQQLSQLDAADARMATDTRFDEPQRQEYMQQSAARRRAIIRTARQTQKPEQPPIEDEVRKGVFWDGGEFGQGNPWVRDPKTGQLQIARGYKPPEAKKPEANKADMSSPINLMEIFGKVWKQIKSEKDAAVGVGETAKPPTDDEVYARMRKFGFTITGTSDAAMDADQYRRQEEDDRRVEKQLMGGQQPPQQLHSQPGMQTQRGSVVQQAIEAARKGDVRAQEALKKRGIQW